MNMSRLAVPVVAAFVVDQIYGFLVWGTLLMPEFDKYPGVFRSKEGVMAHLPLMMAGGLLAVFALAVAYSKGYEGGSGTAEGLRFGCLIGTFLVGAIAIGNYATLSIGRWIAVESAVASFVEALVVGLVLGLTYKPSAQPRARSAAAV